MASVDMSLVMQDYKNGMTVKQLKAKYNLNNNDLKTLNENIRKELGVSDDDSPLPNSIELTLEDGTKVLAVKIKTVNQPKGGFVNLFITADGKKYYQYVDENGKQQRVTDCWDQLGATGDNIEVAWNKLQDGHTWDAIMTLMQGAEDPRMLNTGIAPCMDTKGISLKSLKKLGSWLKKLKNVKNFAQFKSFARNIKSAQSIEAEVSAAAKGSSTAAKTATATETGIKTTIQNPKLPKNYKQLKSYRDAFPSRISELEYNIRHAKDETEKAKLMAELEKVQQEFQKYNELLAPYEKELTQLYYDLQKAYPNAKGTLSELSNQGYQDFTTVNGAIKAVKTQFGKTTISFINPQNGKVVKTIQEGNTGQLITTLQKDGSYIHQLNSQSGIEKSVVKYIGYSADGTPVAAATQSIEITVTNTQTGRTVTQILDNNQINMGLSYSERFMASVSEAAHSQGMSYKTASVAASMPSQDYNAISFLTPKKALGSWGTPVIENILYVCK